MRLLELQSTKQQIRRSDREDAHANGEAFHAREQIKQMQMDAIHNLHSVPVVYTQSRVQQGAVSIEQRFPVEVHARVYRHGVGAHNSGHVTSLEQSVINSAQLEEITILRKNWTMVMREMISRITTRKRAKVAKQTVDRNKGVAFLDSELQRLEAADKAPCRQQRVCSSLGVAPDDELPRLQGTFEKMFLAKPVRLDNKHIVYRTGSHLVQANLDKHVAYTRHQQEAQQREEGSSRFPTWHAELPEYNLGPAAQAQTHLGMHDVRSSNSSSSAVSDELHVLHSGLYQDLDGASTASDIPMISRPPPQWTTFPAEETATATASLEVDQQWRQSTAVDVRIPRPLEHVRLERSTPPSPDSVAASDSTFSDVGIYLPVFRFHYLR